MKPLMDRLKKTEHHNFLFVLISVLTLSRSSIVAGNFSNKNLRMTIHCAFGIWEFMKSSTLTLPPDLP